MRDYTAIRDVYAGAADGTSLRFVISYDDDIRVPVIIMVFFSSKTESCVCVCVEAVVKGAGLAVRARK